MGELSPEQRHTRQMALDLMREGFRDSAPHLFDALCDIVCERHKQEAVHKDDAIVRMRSGFKALSALVEEVGELATALLTLADNDPERDPDRRADILHNLRYEAVQVAASACAIVEAVDAGNYR